MSTPDIQITRLRDTVLTKPTVGDRLRRVRALLANAFGELYKSKTALIGFIMLVILATLCILTPYIDRYDPIKTNYRVRLQAPSEQHWFGTDRFGRDIYSRVLWGGRRLVVIALASVAVGLLIGVPLGILSGYFGGWTDALSMRFVDGLLAFPGLLLYLLFVTLAREWKLEAGWVDLVLILALGIAAMPEFARLSRGAALAEKEREYVEASEVMGESHFRTAMSTLR